jgi:hypothetical protein
MKLKKIYQLKNKFFFFESIKLTRQTCDMSHKIKITIKKANHKNYEIQSPINQVLKDEIKNKNKNIVFF